MIRLSKRLAVADRVCSYPFAVVSNSLFSEMMFLAVLSFIVSTIRLISPSSMTKITRCACSRKLTGANDNLVKETPSKLFNVLSITENNL